MSNNNFYVYEHWRLDRDECFYVGKGKGRRAYSMGWRNPHHKAIQAKVVREGFAIEVRMVATGMAEDDAFALERERILFWREAGVDLSNITDGGGGIFNPSDIARKSISDANKNRVWSLLSRQKISIASRGKKRSPETIEKVAASLRGKKHSIERREKNSISQRGYKQSPEHIQKATASRIGLERSAETQKKISVAAKGRPMSEEHRANLAAALLKINQDPKHIEKVVAALRGKKATLQARANMASAQTGRKHSDETRKKMSESAKAFRAAQRLKEES